VPPSRLLSRSPPRSRRAPSRRQTQRRSAHAGKVQRLREVSGCRLRGREEGFASAPACEKKYGSGKVPWKRPPVIAAGDGLVCRGAAAASTAMGGTSPQELAVPSCAANVTAPCGSQAGRFAQLLGSRPPPAQILRARSHTDSPFLGRPGEKRETHGPTRLAAPCG